MREIKNRYKSLSVSQVTSTPRLTPGKMFRHAQCSILDWCVKEIKSRLANFTGDQNLNSTQAQGFGEDTASQCLVLPDPGLDPP